MEIIPFDDFKRMDIRIGTILAAERIPESDRLLKLFVDFGVDEASVPVQRQIVSGIAAWYVPEELTGRQAVFILNLEPKTFRGVESQGMIFAATDAEGRVSLLRSDHPVPPGASVQ